MFNKIYFKKIKDKFSRTYFTSIKNSGFVSGFTIVEMLISISLFSFVMLGTTSVLLTSIDANRKSQGLKISIDNLSLALESVTRNLRTGTKYSSSYGNGNCSGSGPSAGKTGISFLDQRGFSTHYRLNAGAIEVSKDGGGNFSAMTTPEINIERLCFYITGSSASDDIQARVLVSIGGVVSSNTASGSKTKTLTRFDIQTFVSQRLLDQI